MGIPKRIGKFLADPTAPLRSRPLARMATTVKPLLEPGEQLLCMTRADYPSGSGLIVPLYRLITKKSHRYILALTDQHVLGLEVKPTGPYSSIKTVAAGPHEDVALTFDRWGGRAFYKDGPQGGVFIAPIWTLESTRFKKLLERTS
jgi:hypothetical protein